MQRPPRRPAGSVRPAEHRPLHPNALRTVALTTLLAAVASGCSTGEQSTGNTSTASSSTAAAENPAPPVAPYIMAVEAGRALDYRIDWQYPSTGLPVQGFFVEDDSVLVVDEQNSLTRIRREEGDRVWRVPVGTPLDRILGVHYREDLERVYVMTGAYILELDSDTGSLLDKQDLNRVASTRPVMHRGSILYGSRDGQLVWHAYRMGTMIRAYEIADWIRTPPVLEDGYVVAVGNDGEVVSLDAYKATAIWKRKMLGPVTARPAMGDGIVFVPSLDQHLRAFDVSQPRAAMWEYLTESPLVDSPVVVRDRVYQQVASEGLVCLEANPLDNPGGVVVWRADTTGSVLTEHDGELLVWEADRKSMVLVDARLGAVVETIHMPNVADIMATSPIDGVIYATSPDGRITRAVPR